MVTTMNAERHILELAGLPDGADMTPTDFQRAIAAERDATNERQAFRQHFTREIEPMRLPPPAPLDFRVS